MTNYHETVLLNEAVKQLNIVPNGVYVDATFGGGGHSKEILKKLVNGKLIAFDQDQASLINTIQGDKRFKMVNANFRNLTNEISALGINSINGLIADLGVSGYHFTDNDRGFSLKYNSIIDMRMDNRLINKGQNILNNYSKDELNRIFKDYADFKHPGSITSAIINYRKKNTIKTTFEFKKIFQNFFSKKHENKFFARLFQAVRIEVNDEINALKDLLKQAKDILVPKGRMVIISYHSVEDRLVKNFMKHGNFKNNYDKDFFGNQYREFNVITKKPITPSVEEINTNNKSRSAKLRSCEKI